LGILAKAPEVGRVKTRLAAVAGPDVAAGIGHAFLLDSLDRFAEFPASRLVLYDPPQAHEFFRSIAGHRYELRPQAVGDLGQRLECFFAQEFDSGASAVVAVGSDSPTLPTSLLTQAFDALASVDVVLGPATDGGYYLLGCSRPLGCIFENISWSSSEVLGQTIERLRANQARFALLDPWYDVDTWDDWNFLLAHLAAMRLAGLDPQVPRTEALSRQ
jgi:rSAM/selenodomain-associated transferase 1